MKISEYKDEEALDLLADLIAPASRIFSNRQLALAVQNGKNRLEIARLIIKADKKAVMEILAILDGVPVNEYHCTVPSILMKLMEILNDEELLSFFSSQAQMAEQTSSPFGSQNTQENEQ